MSILTFLVPGLGQLLNGRIQKALAMFLCAFLGGAFWGGLLWFVCGAWSAVDYLGGTPKGILSREPARRAVSEIVLSWVYKFSVLALFTAIVFYKGNALKSINMLGFKLDFFPSNLENLGSIDDGAPRSPGNNGGGAADGVEVNAYRPRSDERAGPPSPSEGVTLAGWWRSRDGAEYELTQEGNNLRIREVSRLFNILSVETASCTGTISDDLVQADCVTGESTGRLQLILDLRSGSLVGTYTDRLTGMAAPVVLSRG